jgi:hypothetical protein
MEKNWLIISWKHDNYMDGGYGKCLDKFYGTYEAAAEYAREYVSQNSPVGVVGVIE